MLKITHRILLIAFLLNSPLIVHADDDTMEDPNSSMTDPNPKDVVEFTCKNFTEKSKNCESYTCQTPYNLDPSVKTKWEILGKNNNRCTISHTTDDIGLKDENDNPIPITKTCDYDETGIQNLNTLFDDMQANYFSATSDIEEGAYNCMLTSNGQPIKSSLTNPGEE